MNSDLVHYGLGTAFVAVVAASAIFGLSQVSTASLSNAGAATTQAEQPAERTVRVILNSPYGH